MKTFKTTKSIILTALMVVGTLFTSCSSDDNDASIVGVWKRTTTVSETFKAGVSQSKTTYVSDAENYSKITFNADGTYSEYEISSNDSPSTDPGTYTFTSDVLTLKYDGEDTVFEKFPYTLSNNNLVLIYTEDYESEGGVAAKNVTTTTYTRQ
ncbi:hypothetical protein HNP99_002818 [Flavobacterium sp. 28A]|uniref:lipocalin family protein n=1 Tax=Flavobacterium sp. 28A TaxID=2735895 RepID=UPI00156FBF22|nr:lipocalin family protein [Flavobacterium sp. 28A]NRT16451.1 hypothetical protein [Flavobacterium sp. 28A]